MRTKLSDLSLPAAVALALLAPLSLAAADLLPPPSGVDAKEIARRAEEIMRGNTIFMEAKMTIASPRLLAPRTVAFRAWDDRSGKRSFIRILSPAKDAGTTFLKLHPNLWMYIPRVERTTRIPPSMMLQSWMGSDFTNDDLVNESSELDDYDHRLLGIDPHPEGAEGQRCYVVEYRPHEDAPVVWGRIVSWIESEHSTPVRQDFYDEDGERLRTIRFSDIRPVQGRYFPHGWLMRPLDREGYETRIEIGKVRFDQAFDDSMFTTAYMRKKWR